jgi:Flp pilus assembly protein TadD
LDIAPNHRLALRVLFECRKAQNRAGPAEILARRLAALPGPPALRANANLLLAQYVIAQGRHGDALAPAGAAVIAAPREPSAHHVLGIVLTETGRLRPGAQHYRRALALLGREDGLVLANLAWNLKLQGRLDDAAALYAQALALRADNKRGIGGYAQVEFARGNIERAIMLLDAALTRWPDARTLRLLRAHVDLHCGDAEAVLARLPEAPEPLLPQERVLRGQALAQLGQPVAAVAQYRAAKTSPTRPGAERYQREKYVLKLNLYKSYFTSNRSLSLPRADPIPRPPVFLLGFPRSGTSLLEQLLAQLPGFAAGDDFLSLADLAELVPRLAGPNAPPYPEALDHLLVGEGAAIPAQLRTRYQTARAGIGLVRPETRFITDRAPDNHWHLGLINLLFPDAPIIHLLRHPLDLMLSNLSQARKLEGNCQVSMADTARHYALGMEMIAHDRGQLTLRYLPVRYEDLVADAPATLRRVLDFIGADPSTLPPPDALRANAAPRPTPTPVHFAFRQPVHQRSRYRFREYETLMPELFAEVREILNPLIAGLGYVQEAP